MKVRKEDSINFKPQKNSNLLLGIIFVGILGTVLFLLLRSEQTSTMIDEAIASQEERLSNIEEQILIFDEVKASDSVLTSLSIQINKNEEQIDILWRNIREHNAIFDEIKETLNALIQEFQERKIEIDDDIAMINVDINDLRLSTDDMQNVLNSEINFLQNELKNINKQILFLEESVQALEGYRTQNNQILQEIQNSINNKDAIKNNAVDE